MKTAAKTPAALGTQDSVACAPATLDHTLSSSQSNMQAGSRGRHGRGRRRRRPASAAGDPVRAGGAGPEPGADWLQWATAAGQSREGTGIFEKALIFSVARARTKQAAFGVACVRASVRAWVAACARARAFVCVVGGV